MVHRNVAGGKGAPAQAPRGIIFGEGQAARRPRPIVAAHAPGQHPGHTWAPMMEYLHVMLSAAKWGALIGVAIYLVSQFITFISLTALGPGPVDPAHPARVTLGCVGLLLIIFAFSASGYYAGRETRQAGYGAIAGMVTFAVYGALISLYTYGGRASQASGATLGQQIVIELISVTLYLIVAALIGWLGGRPGSSQARARDARLAQQPTTPPQQQ